MELTGIAARPTFAEAAGECVVARPVASHRPGNMVMPWIGPLLNRDRPGHVRVQRAKVLVVTRGSEGKREAVVRIHRLGAEFSGRHHGVRDVVVVGPGDGIADLYLQLLR